MTYQVLARKYRPQQFDEVIAQEHVTRTLKNALKSGRISSGYLFTGPRGTGKTTTARILAKALNCVEGPAPTPCEKCDSCKEITAGSSLDVLEIDAASNTGVDDIRALRENVRYLPTSGKKRIYIIDEVHRLSGSAFDALLKTLEEPPPHVLFIFATTEPHKVPETIRSRTQRYDFHRVGVLPLSDHLKKIAESESLSVDEEAILLIARKADGSVRDGMSLLDQISAFATEKIDRQAVIDALGLIDRKFYFDYVRAIAAKDISASLSLVQQLCESGGEIPEFLRELTGHFRNLLILKNAKEPRRLLELSDSEYDDYKEQLDYFSTGDILRIIKLTANMIQDLKSGLDERLLLETNTIRLASLESTVLFEDILAHLSEAVETEEEETEDAGKDLFGAPVDPKSSSPTSPTPGPKIELNKETPAPAPRVAGRAVNLAMLQNSWDNYIDHLKGKSRMLAAIMSMAEIKEIKGNTVTAIFYNAGGTSKQVVEKPEYRQTITASLNEFFNSNLQINFEIDPNKKKLTAEKEKPKFEKVDAEKVLADDPKLRHIVESFNGEIVGKKKIE